MDNPAIVMSSGVGVRTTIDLTNGLKYGLDWPGQYWGNDPFAPPNPAVGDHRYGRRTSGGNHYLSTADR